MAFDNKEPIVFSGDSDSLRIGPQATLTVSAFRPGPKSLFDIARLSGNVAYAWAQEVYSGDDYEWLAASITYNIDDEGHLGLVGGYEKGVNQLTGEEMDLVKVTLSAKY